MSPDDVAIAVAMMYAEITALGQRIDRVTTLTLELVDDIERVTAERDAAVDIADAVRSYNARLERELSDVIRQLVAARGQNGQVH